MSTRKKHVTPSRPGPFHVAWDIETAPLPKALADALAETDPIRQLLDSGAECTVDAVEAATERIRAATEKGWRYGRTKDAEILRAKLSEDMGNAARKVSRDMSFNPASCMIVSAAFAGRHPSTGRVLGEVRTLNDVDGDERKLVEWQWACLQSTDRIVTHNGADFDARVLLLRSAALGIAPPISLSTRRGSHNPLTDTLLVVTGGDRSLNAKKGNGLDAVCRRYGVGVGKGGMDGSKVAGLVDEGRWDEIAQYNLGDVIDRTLPLYEHLLTALIREDESHLRYWEWLKGLRAAGIAAPHAGTNYQPVSTAGFGMVA